MTNKHGSLGKFFDRLFGRRDLIARKLYLVIFLFVAIVSCLFVLDRFQAYVTNSVRAFVAGEGFWSKGQKDGVYHLMHYAASFDDAEYQKFLQGVAVSLGDRQARLTLQSEHPDLNKARQGFLQGRNHPGDIDKVTSFFLHFSGVSDMKQAIAIWSEGDRLIDELLRLGSAIHDQVNSASPDRGRIDATMEHVDALNSRLSELEDRFSATLGNGARKLESLTATLVTAATLLLLLIGIVLSRQIVRGMRMTQGALEASEARFRHVVESNIVGIMFWASDGSVTDANDAFLSIVGYTRGDLAAGRLNWQALTPDEFKATDAEAIDEIRRKGYCEPYEKQFLNKDGQRVSVYLGAALFDSSEESGVCFVLDISGRKRAEQMQKLATSVFLAAREAIVVTDRRAAIKAVNPAFTEITGYAEAEVVGQNPSVLSSGHHKPDFYRKMWKRLESSGSWKGEIWNRRKNGDIYQEWLSISAIRDDNGEVSAFVGVFSDITEQRIMEEQLKQSQKMEAIGTLVGGIAHDFNNTLAAMQGNLYLAKRRNENMAVSEKLENIDRLSAHSAEMVQQLLTFARKGVVQMIPLSLNDFFRRLGRLTATVIPENIAFGMQLCDEVLTVRGDATQLQQMLLNLLNNARDAVADSKEPAILCRLERFEPDADFREHHPGQHAAAMAHVEIRDNGCGIAEEQLEHIFEPFYTTKEVGKGTGLGMAMVYGAVRTHKGVIEVQSRQGEGTSMHLYLPLVESVAEVRQPAEQPHAHAAPDERRATVLLVDDDVNVRTACADALGSMGYEVLTAEDGVAAVACFERNRERISLVITDVVMPRLGGFAAVDRMRQQVADLPAIFMTGYAPEQAAIPEQGVRNSAMLNKPFQIGELARLVQELHK